MQENYISWKKFSNDESGTWNGIKTEYLDKLVDAGWNPLAVSMAQYKTGFSKDNKNQKIKYILDLIIESTDDSMKFDSITCIDPAESQLKGQLFQKDIDQFLKEQSDSESYTLRRKPSIMRMIKNIFSFKKNR